MGHIASPSKHACNAEKRREGLGNAYRKLMPIPLPCLPGRLPVYLPLPFPPPLPTPPLPCAFDSFFAPKWILLARSQGFYVMPRQKMHLGVREGEKKPQIHLPAPSSLVPLAGFSTRPCVKPAQSKVGVGCIGVRVMWSSQRLLPMCCCLARVGVFSVVRQTKH